MVTRFTALSVFVLAGVAAAPCLGQHTASGACSSPPTATTASYTMAASIGPQEEMYLPSEVKARHIKDGEIMLGGDMSMVQKKPGTKIFHLEVHICDRSGAVVKKLKPLIVVNAAGQAAAMTVPAAVMVGIGEPMTDYHYGNDVVLKPGSKLTVRTTVQGQTAVFHLTAPK
jgi:hypothetical protein